jgi:hypothetical protein
MNDEPDVIIDFDDEHVASRRHRSHQGPPISPRKRRGVDPDLEPFTTLRRPSALATGSGGLGHGELKSETEPNGLAASVRPSRTAPRACEIVHKAHPTATDSVGAELSDDRNLRRVVTDGNSQLTAVELDGNRQHSRGVARRVCHNLASQQLGVIQAIAGRTTAKVMNCSTCLAGGIWPGRET